MKEFWDQRYSSENFVYGKEPNGFFKTELQKIDSPGKILFIGEGEGRNAVFAAKLGWDVDAVDFSESAEKKALILAREENVKINYYVQDISDFDFPQEHYDAVVIIFFHLKEDEREQLHRNVLKSLKNNGKVILEVFDKDQISRNSGGPKDLSLLYSLEDVYTDFNSLKIERFSKDVILLEEGIFHEGEAVVIRFVGIKS